MTITQALSLDVARESVVRISAKQFDSNSRYLLITVLESGQEQTIPSASTITLNGRRPDGSSQSFLGEVQDGKAYLKIDDYLLEQYGTVYCSVSIIGSDGAKLSTLSFRMVVERAESTGWVLMYTAPSALSAGTYHINVGSISYEFTLTQALPVGGCIYFASDYTGAKTVVNGADVETLTLTVGTGGNELIGSDVVNFLTQISQEVAEINEGLESKADKSAIEENLSAGTSLATIDKDSYTPNTSPYLHRISPSGKRCEYDVIGGTVGWNQLVPPTTISYTQYGITYASTGNGVWTITGALVSGQTQSWCNLNYTAGEQKIIGGHIFYAQGGDAEMRLQFASNTNIPTTIEGETIVKPIFNTGTTATWVRYQTNNHATLDKTFTPQVIDLTTLLGSTIADYAYQLEQTTAGSGIAWLKSFGFLSKDYYEYCEPTLKSVEATARKAVGINQWDEEWELGNLSVSGQKSTSTTNIRTKNFIPVLPNTQYCITASANTNNGIMFYEEQSTSTFIGKQYTSGGGARTFTTPTNCHYILFALASAYGTTYLNDVCINLSNPTINGTYYSYEEHSYPLGEITLRGIPKLDSNNNIYYDGDVYKASGEITRKYGILDLGTLKWVNLSQRFRAPLDNAFIPSATAIPDAKIVEYPLYPANTDFGSLDKGMAFISGGGNNLLVRDTSYTTASAFKTAMSGVYLVYELATPTTETTDSFTPIQYTGSTEEFSTDNDVPVGVDARYYTDLTLPTLPTANGTYTLKCTVTDGTGIVSWVSE